MSYRVYTGSLGPGLLSAMVGGSSGSAAQAFTKNTAQHLHQVAVLEEL